MNNGQNNDLGRTAKSLHAARQTEEAEFLAKRRLEIESSLEPVLDLTMAWVVITPARKPLATDDDSIRKILEEANAALPEMFVDEITQERIDDLRAARQSVNDSITTDEEHASFLNREIAELFQAFIGGADQPILLPIVDINTEVDKYRENVLSGKQPYSIMLRNGEIFESWGGEHSEDPINRIDEIGHSIGDDGSESLTGTFWATNFFGAINAAQDKWDELVHAGVFAKLAKREDDLHEYDSDLERELRDMKFNGNNDEKWEE